MRRSIRHAVLGSAMLVAMLALVGGAAAASGWVRVPSPNVANSTNRLIAVAAIPGTTNAWAVGTYQPTSGDATQARGLIERWNGSAWVRVAAGTTAKGVVLNAVTAYSANDAWAVGSFIDSNAQTQPISLRWNGAKWTSVPIDGVPTEVARANAVTEIGPKNVWAVGTASGGSGDSPLLWHWDGTSWDQFAPTLPDGAEGAGFTNIKRVPGPSNWLIAVGSVTMNGVDQILLERYDGSSWTPITAPSAASHPRAVGLAVKSARDVWITGTVARGSTTVPYSTHWNGTSWTQRVLPFASGTTTGAAPSISLVPGTSQAWAVGYRGGGPGDIPLSWRWTGVKWVSANVPNPANGNVLSGVVATAAGTVWAVGWHEGPAGVGTFVVRR